MLLTKLELIFIIKLMLINNNYMLVVTLKNIKI